MLDIRFIVEHKELVALGARKKYIDPHLDELIALEKERRGGAPVDMHTWQRLMLGVPNMPDISVPEGATPKENVLLRSITTTNNTPLEYSSLLAFFSEPERYAPALVSPTDIVGVGLTPQDDSLVYVSEHEILSPTPLIGLLKTGVSGKTIDYQYTYADDDSVSTREVCTILRVCEGTHMHSVQEYASLTQQLDTLLTRCGVSVEVYAVCGGALGMSDVTATVYMHEGKEIARVAYQHDFLARRMRIKHGSSLAHTVTAHIYLDALTYAKST